ncbi:MAG TPA: tetratricopeptide repeat protein, partial [Terriglobales bacterium]|nr:tetratricopeptide repeat protein [Terriglobales bacterium]
TDDVHGALAQYRAALNIDRDLATADPDNAQAILDLSFSESKFGSALGKLGQTKEALANLRSGIARQEYLADRDANHVLLYNHLANSYTRLANCLLDSGNTKEATEYYRKAVASRLSYFQKSPNSSMNRGALAECYTNLAKALAPWNHEEALNQYSRAVDLLEPLTTTDRSNARGRIALADALSNTAQLYMRMTSGESSTRLQYLTKAKSYYQRSQEMWLGLEKAGKLPPARSRAIRDINTELAHCNESLAKLQQVQ